MNEYEFKILIKILSSPPAVMFMGLLIGVLVGRKISSLASRLFFLLLLPLVYILGTRAFFQNDSRNAGPGSSFAAGWMFMGAIFSIFYYYIGYAIGKFSRYFPHHMEDMPTLGDKTNAPLIALDRERISAINDENRKLIQMELEKIQAILEEVRQDRFSKLTAFVDKNRQVTAYQKLKVIADFLGIKLIHEFLPEVRGRTNLGKLEENLIYLRELIKN